MNSAKNFALIALALTAIGAAGFAWRQQARIESLRAALAGDDRAQWKQRAVAAEQRAKSLADELAAARDRLAEAKPAGEKTDSPRQSGDAGPAANLRTMIASAANMMNNPEMQKIMALRQKAALDANYATLFKHLGLPADKLERLKQLMVERQQVGADVFAAAAQQGLDPMQNRRELGRMTAEGQAKIDGDIRSLLGDADYAAYQNYQATLPQRNVVNQLQQALSYTANPLSESQAEQLVQILAQNQPSRPAGAGGQPVAVSHTAVAANSTGQPVTVSRVVTGSIGGWSSDAGFVGPAVAFGGSTVTDSAVSASRSVLSDPQVEALQQIQQQQQQMRAAVQSMGGGQPGQGGAAVIQFNATTDVSAPGHPPPAPPEGGKPPGGG